MKKSKMISDLEECYIAIHPRLVRSLAFASEDGVFRDARIKRMAEGDPLYVLAEAFDMPMDFQLTIGKQSQSLDGRNCFILDIAEVSQQRLRDGGVLHLEPNKHWPITTFIYYGKGGEELKRMTEALVEELTGKTFEELTGTKIDDVSFQGNI